MLLIYAYLFLSEIDQLSEDEEGVSSHLDKANKGKEIIACVAGA